MEFTVLRDPLSRAEGLGPGIRKMVTTLVSAFHLLRNLLDWFRFVFVLFLFVCVLDHAWLCSGFTSSSMFKDYSWQCLGSSMGYRGQPCARQL